MTSTKTNTNSDKTEKKKKISPPPHSAPDKVQAVLAVWTERCKPAEVCRQLNINWVTFNQWQQRAMEGMLQALESRVNLTKGEALSPRLQALLQHRQRTVTTARLTNRLEQINKVANPPPTPAKTE
jgi:flagellin-specific chaperone FliS